MIMFIDIQNRAWMLHRDGKITMQRRPRDKNIVMIKESLPGGRSNKDVEDLIRAMTLSPSKSCEVIKSSRS